MYYRNIVKTFVILLFICISNVLSAQLTYGVTGLLHAPSAEMQRDKTVMLGANFMNREITPPRWNYHTYNYYLNVTIMPWIEIAYTCTLFTAESLGLKPYGYSGFTNQDRYFSVRLRALKEGQFWKHAPAVVLGASDPFTSSGGGKINSKTGNGFYSRFFIAATKHVRIGSEEVGVHLSYLYNERLDYPLNGIAGGITYSPSMLPNLKVIAEYDTKDFAFGATYLLFNCLHTQVEMQRMKYFTGGLTYKFVLK
ncbi:YjbH domain-containing protein [Bacteroides sp. OttesenSCG-928-E20]|nr:YjbH domain-containing protein [Bacteroides sp. OttesenSCG-928-E20]MDL2305878.1 YjbH domain-containing protein [Bacteroides sp. OttesenSCG-928-D19]